MSKRTLLIIVTSLVIGLLFALFLYTNRPKDTYTNTTPKTAETAGGRVVGFTNIAGLSDILLPSQTQAFRTGVNAFLLEYLDPNITGAKIDGKPLIQTDGSVMVTVTAKATAGKKYSFVRKDPDTGLTNAVTITGESKASYTFPVIINRNNINTLTLSIRPYNYTSVEDL